MYQKSSSELAWVNDELMPFLRENWDDIDQLEPGWGECDRRLHRAELFVAYGRAIEFRDEGRAKTLLEIIARYDLICQAYEDGYWYGEEAELGISENDVSVYQKLVDPDYPVADGKPKPEYWF